jgi:hypothetical protein
VTVPDPLADPPAAPARAARAPLREITIERALRVVGEPFRSIAPERYRLTVRYVPSWQRYWPSVPIAPVAALGSAALGSHKPPTLVDVLLLLGFAACAWGSLATFRALHTRALVIADGRLRLFVKRRQLLAKDIDVDRVRDVVTVGPGRGNRVILTLHDGGTVPLFLPLAEAEALAVRHAIAAFLGLPHDEGVADATTRTEEGTRAP